MKLPYYFIIKKKFISLYYVQNIRARYEQLQQMEIKWKYYVQNL